MLTINLIRENKDFVIERLRVKNFDATETVDKILELDQMRREIQSKFDQAQGDMNRISKEIGIMMKEGRKDEAAR
ncbi:MAG: serine--tRNA ligase, partial [Bacteroidales bacterium]|nr:serine--tRNA ligase [Bacteroidales bacterium]